MEDEMSDNLTPKIHRSLRCWCGAEMREAGIGKFPYDCIAKDKHPNSMVYIGCGNDHMCWDYADNPRLSIAWKESGIELIEA